MMVLFYIGVAINIIGDILLGAYAVKFYFAFRGTKSMPVKLDELKARWQSSRKIAFGMIIGGCLISLIAMSAGM